MIQRRGEDMKRRKYVFIAIVAVALFQICTACQIKAESDLPKVIITKKGEKKLMLPKTLSEDIRRNYPDLVMPTMRDKKDDWLECVKKDVLPSFYCQGDFNGDGLLDVALILLDRKDKSMGKLIVFHRTDKKSYESFVLIDDLKYSTWYSMYTQKPGEIVTAAGKGYGRASDEEPAKITLKNDGIFLLYANASSIFHWENGKYIETWTSD